MSNYNLVSDSILQKSDDLERTAIPPMIAMVVHPVSCTAVSKT